MKTLGIIALGWLFTPLTFAAPVELTRSCQEHLLSAVENQNLIVDLNLGLLSVESYDPETDALDVRFRDLHRTYRMVRGRVKYGGAYSQSQFKIAGASSRILAELGHKDSLAIMHSRTGKILGIRRSGHLFAMFAINDRIANVVWNREVRDKAISRINQKRAEEGRALLSHLEITAANASDLEEFIREVFALSGENLVRAGILVHYSNPYSRMTWAGGGSFIPQDIDHYAHSFLWRRSAQLFNLGQPVIGREARRILAVDNAQLETNLVSHLKPISFLMISKKVESWVPEAYTTAIVWRKIFNMAGTVNLNEEFLDGDIVILAYTAGTSEFLLGELMRKLMDAGAAQVQMIQAP